MTLVKLRILVTFSIIPLSLILARMKCPRPCKIPTLCPRLWNLNRDNNRNIISILITTIRCNIITINSSSNNSSSIININLAVGEYFFVGLFCLENFPIYSFPLFRRGSEQRRPSMADPSDEQAQNDAKLSFRYMFSTGRCKFCSKAQSATFPVHIMWVHHLCRAIPFQMDKIWLFNQIQIYSCDSFFI